MPKKVIRVYISPELKRVLMKMVEKLGLSESEVLRVAFIHYADHYGLIEEKILRKTESSLD